MKKIIGVVAVLLVIGFSGCKKENTATGTCSDGIKNQNETGIDCGGVCNACPSLLCDGNGSDSYYPIAVGNSWRYNLYFDTIVAQINGLYILKLTMGTITEYDTLRVANNGDIYTAQEGDPQQNLAVPSNPYVGQTWSGPKSNGRLDTLTVLDLNASIVTYSCSYSNCLKIQAVSNRPPYNVTPAIFYSKKGIGLVYAKDAYNIYQLVSVKLN